MIEVQNKKDYGYLFECYTYGVSLIYSTLNDEYEGHLYLDKLENPTLAILCTQFYSIYVTGDPCQTGIAKKIEQVLWHNHIPTYHQKKLYAFSPNESWNEVFDEVFGLHEGRMETRLLYQLNISKFEQLYHSRKIPLNVSFEFGSRNDRHARNNYPAFQAFINQEEVGFCTGYTFAKNRAQLDIHTKEGFRNLGIAKENSFRMINLLKDRAIQVDYICNPSKPGVCELANSLGFEKASEIYVHVWKYISKENKPKY